MLKRHLKSQLSNLQDSIKATAWKQIAEYGAPALSLRAIARELNITAPAIYNYFADRDALVTALVIDAFTSFGDSQLASLDAMAADDHANRLNAIGLAYRNWAHRYTQRYLLIFSVPIPGYVAPMAQVGPSSARSIRPLFEVVEAIRVAGRLNDEAYRPIQPAYEAAFEQWRAYVGPIHPLTHFVAMTIWSRVHGFVSLEIHGHFPPFGDNGDALYLTELHSIQQQFLKS